MSFTNNVFYLAYIKKINRLKLKCLPNELQSAPHDWQDGCTSPTSLISTMLRTVLTELVRTLTNI